MLRFLVALLATLIVSGCQTIQEQQQAEEDPILWGRIDCKRLSDGPEYQQQFDQAKLVCVNRAEAAGIAGTAAMPTGYGIGGAIAAGINQGITSAQIQQATIRSCMAEYGYLLGHKGEHEARCPVTPAVPPRPPSENRRPKVASQSGAAATPASKQ